MYLPALPNIMTDLNVSHEEAQTTLTFWFLGSASMQLIMGPLSDRYGRRPILLISGFIYILTNVMCAITTDINILLAVRFIQGVTVSAVIVAGYASIHELYDQSHAIRILAVMGSITIIAPAFGPLIGGAILNYVNWRWIFWIIAIMATISIASLTKWMPESLPPKDRHPINLKFLGKNYFAILSNWRFTGVSLTFCFSFCGFIAWLTAGPFIIVDEFNLSVLMFGIYQAIIFSCYVFTNFLINKLIDKYPVNHFILVGLVITLSGGVYAAISAVLFPNYLLGLIIGMMIFSFGSGLTFAPLNRLTIESSPEPMGIRMAMMSTYMTVFGVVGSILGSVFYNGTLASLGFVLASVSSLAFIIFINVFLFSKTGT